MYRKMKRPMASSRCYELLGQFNRALIVLYENEYFDMAIDTLKRYRMLMEVGLLMKNTYNNFTSSFYVVFSVLQFEFLI